MKKLAIFPNKLVHVFLRCVFNYSTFKMTSASMFQKNLFLTVIRCRNQVIFIGLVDNLALFLRQSFFH